MKYLLTFLLISFSVFGQSNLGVTYNTGTRVIAPPQLYLDTSYATADPTTAFGLATKRYVDKRVFQSSNVAAAQALTNLVNNDLIQIAGRTTAGDGGGSTVYYSSSSSATTNLGTIFTATGMGTGRLIWNGVGNLTAEMFGAVVNDGVSDVTAITAGLAYLTTQTSGVLYFGVGEYLIDSTIRLPIRTSLVGINDNKFTDVTSVAAGTNKLYAGSTVWRLGNGANCKMLIGDYATNGYVRQANETWEDGSGPYNSVYQSSSIEGIVFMGNGSNQTSYNCDILDFAAKWNLTVRNCTFFAAKGYSARFMDLNYLKWEGNQVVGDQTGFGKGLFLWGSADSIFSDSIFGGTMGPTLWIGGASSAYNLFNNTMNYNAVRTNSSHLVTGPASGIFTTANAHGLETGDPVRWVTDGTMPTGLTKSGISWVTKLSSTTFGVSPTWMNATNGAYVSSYASSGSGNLYQTVGPAVGLYMSDGANANVFSSTRADQSSDGGIYLDGSGVTLNQFSSVIASLNYGSYNSETNSNTYAVTLDGATGNTLNSVAVQGGFGGVLFTNAGYYNYVTMNSFGNSPTNDVTDSTAGLLNSWMSQGVFGGSHPVSGVATFTGTVAYSNSAPTLTVTAGNGTSGLRINVLGGASNLVRFQTNGTTTHTFNGDGSATFTGGLTTTAVTSSGPVSGTTITGSGAVSGTDLNLTGTAPVLTATANNGSSGLRLNVLGGTTALLRIQTNSTTTHTFSGDGSATFTGGLTTTAVTASGAVNAGTLAVGATGSGNVATFTGGSGGVSIMQFVRSGFNTLGFRNTGGFYAYDETAGKGIYRAEWTGSNPRMTIGNTANASPVDAYLTGEIASGSNIAGNDLWIHSGQGTGNASTASSWIRLATPTAGASSSTLQTMTERVRITDDKAASTTALWLDVNGTFYQVTIGAADSAGAGFRQLRIVN